MSLGTLTALVDNWQRGKQFSTEIDDRQRHLNALKALGTTLGQPDGGGGMDDIGSAVGSAVQPRAMPGGPLAAAGGPAAAPPSPGMGGAQNVAALLAKLTGSQGQPQAQPMAPPAQPQVQPQAQPYPDPNLSAVAQSPAMDRPDYNPPSAIDEAHQNIKSIAGSIKAANPGIDPITLAMATEQQIENIKGVAPLTKATMVAQVQAARMGLDFQYKQARLNQMQQDLQIKLERAQTDEEKQQALEEYHQGLIALGYERIDAQRDIAAGHDATSRANTQDRDATSITNTGTRTAASRDNAQTAAGAREYGADQSFRGNQVRGGGQVDPAPQRSTVPTATGPNGEKMQFVKGRWVPAK